MYNFSTWLLDGCERNEVALDRKSGLFGKFASRCGERIFTRDELPLRYRPRTVVLRHPKRATGMDEKDLEAAIGTTEQQETGTRLRYRSLSRTARLICSAAGGSLLARTTTS